ncbi:hypothetical protein OG453_42305 [Streptomyces sp. NBC_01381]|uniref:hypothetical protein n=1 Tax=Streptomyces sp. NBC_01381 TaxID=2903845 RepID=UPI0022585C8C|nr:hypothetical protein [Streptomyces sp. NBC_01381]MCX4673195.1 hypothetical protein [Streptomyces sp. NBC_01381]
MRAGGPAVDTVRIAAGPVCLLPLDAFTGRAPVLRVTAVVERLLTGGRWAAEDDVPVVTTPSGVVVLPSLASAHPAPAPGAVQRLRIRLISPYLLAAEHPAGVEFDAPASAAPPVTRVRLYPLPAYPFPPGTRLLRGRVRRGGAPGAAVAGAAVSGRARADPGHVPRVADWMEYAATAWDGTFRLPLRLVGSKPQLPPANPAEPEAEWFTVTALAAPGQAGGPEASVHLTAQDIRGTEQLIEIP